MHALRSARSPASRQARHYAPIGVVDALGRIARAPQLGLCVDLDALERTRHAQMDRVMQLALYALHRLDVRVALTAHASHARAQLVSARVGGVLESVEVSPSGLLEREHVRAPGMPWAVLTDDCTIATAVSERDCWLRPTRHELAEVGDGIPVADVRIRATLWWIVDQRLSRSVVPELR